MDDDYFETRFTNADEADVAPKKYRTLKAAKALAENLSLDGRGSIWYQNKGGDHPVEIVRYQDDGSVLDVSADDGTSCYDNVAYPLEGVPSIIEPGALMFSLWLHDPDGWLAPYDFGFDWDGARNADWQCSRGGGPGPSCSGTISWTGDDDGGGDEQDSVDKDLGSDLEVEYTSHSPTGEVSGETRIKDAGLWNPVSRSAWVNTARDIFAFLRGRKLI